VDDLEPHGFDPPDLEQRVPLKAATLGGADTIYGTMDGYAALGVPYQPHIAPEIKW
jgi:hypothetical protein